jgi:hypothetical protein
VAVVTKTLKSSGGDYSTIAGWESGEQTNLITDGDSHVLEAYAFKETSTGSFTLGGWGTDATHFVTIQGMGTIALPWSDTSTYTYSTSYTGTGGNFRLGLAYTEVYDIQVEGTATTTNTPVIVTAGPVTVDRLFIKVNAYIYYGFRGQTYECYVSNTILWVDNVNQVVPGWAFYNTHADSKFVNCLAFSGTEETSNNARGFNCQTAINCVTFNYANTYDYTVTTASYCATSQASGSSGLSGTGSVFEITDNWTDSANGDFSYTSFSDLEQAGTNGSAYTGDDIVGNERPATGAWDIGPFFLDLTQSVTGVIVTADGVVLEPTIRTITRVTADIISATGSVIQNASLSGIQFITGGLVRAAAYVLDDVLLRTGPWKTQRTQIDPWTDASPEGDGWSDASTQTDPWTDQ